MAPGPDGSTTKASEGPLPGPPPEHRPVEVPANGDRSLQTFGEAAPNGDYLAIDRLVRRYYVARAKRDVQTLCDLVAQTTQEMLIELAKRSPQAPEDVDCSVALGGQIQGQPDRVGIRVTDARLEGDRGLAFVEIPGLGLSAISVLREDGGWKVANLGAIPLD